MATSQIAVRWTFLLTRSQPNAHTARKVDSKEEGGRGFDGQQRAEDVAHIFRVARPVGPELEFEGDPGHDAEDEVDEEQLSQNLTILLYTSLPVRT